MVADTGVEPVRRSNRERMFPLHQSAINWMRSQTLTAHSTIARARPIRKPPQVRIESSVGSDQHKLGWYRRIELPPSASQAKVLPLYEYHHS